ncbi:MAG: RNA-binding protein [Bdellovibrionaceae bacterium]|nr:RNA-binding protein [Pseudobdellovibrionaceae bacterium]
MNNKLYVGSLSYSVDSEALGNFFAAAGQVTSARVIEDRDSGRSKGFGFVEMSSEDEANSAIEQLNGKELMGRAIIVSIARPQESRGGGGGGRGGRPGGGGGGRRFGGGGGDFRR